MAKKYRIGVASMVHDHVWGDLVHWKAQPNVELVAAGDVNAVLRERATEKFGIEKTYDSWEEMIAAEGDELDIVHIAAENSKHADIVEACAAKGVHVVVEKPMAATHAQAQRMFDATKAAGTKLLINWPIAWYPTLQEMERRLLSGDIGTIRYVKYRSAHNGPREIGCDPHFVEWLYDEEKNGAGAFMDYCCYGAVLCARFLGRPTKVTGLRATLAKDYPIPDDNGMINMEYPHAFGVAEGSWTQPTGYIGPNPIAYGSEGAIAVQGKNLIIMRPGKKTETIEPPAVEAPQRNPAEYMLHSLETGESIEGICDPAIALIAQEILQAGLTAAATGVTQVLA